MVILSNSPICIWCGFLCLKYYRAPRYRMRYVIIVLVERRCKNAPLFLHEVAKINDHHLWKTTYIYEDLTELHYA